MHTLAVGCELDVQRGPDWLLVRIVSVGQDGSSPPPLADELWSLMEQHFTYRIVLELDGLKVLNSHLIGQLVSLYRRISEHDGVMRLCGLSAYNRQVLHTCRLDDRFLPYQDRQEAVMGGNGPRKPR